MSNEEQKDQPTSESGNSTKPVVVCPCGATIPEDKIDYWNGCNDEGEDYAVVTAECPSCKAEYETSQWGEWENKSEAAQYLADCLVKILRCRDIRQPNSQNYDYKRF